LFGGYFGGNSSQNPHTESVTSYKNNSNSGLVWTWTWPDFAEFNPASHAFEHKPHTQRHPAANQRAGFPKS
jgi:hypothetical protein